MNRQLKVKLAGSIEPLLSSRSEHVRIEASRLLLAMNGVWVGDYSTNTPSRVAAKVNLAKHGLYDRMELKRQGRRKANRKAYVKRRIKEGKSIPDAKKELPPKGRTLDETVQAMLDHVSSPVKPVESPKPNLLPEDYADLAVHHVTAAERDEFKTALESARANAPRDEFGGHLEDPDIWPKRDSDLGEWVRRKRKAMRSNEER
jgi:hypothetical protein